jgi:hypothetical protein
MITEPLPFVDEHHVDVALAADDVWLLLLDQVDRSFAHPIAAGYARAIGCDDTAVSGPRPLGEGSAVPGFHVAAIEPRSRLVIAGRHRFATYSLTFRLESTGHRRSRLYGETRAAFPGTGGRVYRMLIIGTGGHVVAVRRLLAGVKRRAETLATTV